MGLGTLKKYQNRDMIQDYLKSITEMEHDGTSCKDVHVCVCGPSE